jgi:hypothetical protein
MKAKTLHPMKLPFLAFLFLSSSAFAEQPMAAVAEDGRHVMIYPDGTWRLIKADPAAAATPIPKSKEGVSDHHYELNQDYTIQLSAGQASIRVKRGEIYPGRILADHAEIDLNGISYSVPRAILHPRPRDATPAPVR